MLSFILSLLSLFMLFLLSYAIANIYQYLMCAIARHISSFLCRRYISFSPPIFTGIINMRNAIKISTICSFCHSESERAKSFNFILVISFCIYIVYVLNYYISLPVSAMHSVNAIISTFPPEWLLNNPIIWYYDLYIIAALHASITFAHSQYTRQRLMLVSCMCAVIMSVAVKARYFFIYPHYGESPYISQYHMVLDSREYSILFINEYYILLLSWVLLSYIASIYILSAYYRLNANYVNWAIIFMCTIYAGVVIYWANVAAEAPRLDTFNGLDGMITLWIVLLLMNSRYNIQASTYIAIICALIARISINVFDKEGVILQYAMGGAFILLIIMYICQWLLWNRQNLNSTHFV